jgi:asparagine synthetase B (glutamine-hydrolysing)
MLTRLAARPTLAARLLPNNFSPSLRAFHSSRAVQCGLVTVLQQAEPFSPLSTALRARWQRDADSVRLALHRGLESIRHRGPDGQNVWMPEDGAVALGHVRLALIDLTPTGSQPLHDWKHNVHVSVNGELYNHREVRAEAEAAGWEFTSSSDSEIALFLYHKHGPLFPQELRGEYAFTLWDEDRKARQTRDRQQQPAGSGS